MSWIKEYNYVPSEFLFHKCSIEKDATPLYLGVELEVAGGGEDEENAQWINEALGENNCYIMHDGSLRNEDGEVDGLEITTHPCTLEYHKSLNYKEVFEYIENYLIGGIRYVGHSEKYKENYSINYFVTKSQTN